MSADGHIDNLEIKSDEKRLEDQLVSPSISSEGVIIGSGGALSALVAYSSEDEDNEVEMRNDETHSGIVLHDGTQFHSHAGGSACCGSELPVNDASDCAESGNSASNIENCRDTLESVDHSAANQTSECSTREYSQNNLLNCQHVAVGKKDGMLVEGKWSVEQEEIIAEMEVSSPSNCVDHNEETDINDASVTVEGINAITTGQETIECSAISEIPAGISISDSGGHIVSTESYITDPADTTMPCETDGEIAADSSVCIDVTDEPNECAVGGSYCEENYIVQSPEEVAVDRGQPVSSEDEVIVIDRGLRDEDCSSSSTSSATEDSDSSSTCGDDSGLDDDEQNGSRGDRTRCKKWTGPLTKGELSLSELPAIEHLQINVPEDQCTLIGHVVSVIGVLVVVDSVADAEPLDIDSLLFLERGRRPLGRIYDVMGPVTQPSYCVRFNSQAEIEQFGVKLEEDVYFVPGSDVYTHYVFLQALRQVRGSDASWWDSNEPPQDQIDYSDDEQERIAKRKRGRAREHLDDEEVRVLDKGPDFHQRVGKGAVRGRGRRKRLIGRSHDMTSQIASPRFNRPQRNPFLPQPVGNGGVVHAPLQSPVNLHMNMSRFPQPFHDYSQNNWPPTVHHQQAFHSPVHGGNSLVRPPMFSHQPYCPQPSVPSACPPAAPGSFSAFSVPPPSTQFYSALTPAHSHPPPNVFPAAHLPSASSFMTTPPPPPPHCVPSSSSASSNTDHNGDGLYCASTFQNQ